MKIIGISSGVNGGIAILGTITGSIEYFRTPIVKVGKYDVIDAKRLQYAIKGADIIGIEKQYIDSVQSDAMAIDGNYYMLLWACRNENFKEILPQKWIKAFSLVSAGQRRNKQHYIDYVNEF
jgi:hypothetical protein